MIISVQRKILMQGFAKLRCLEAMEFLPGDKQHRQKTELIYMQESHGRIIKLPSYYQNIITCIINVYKSFLDTRDFLSGLMIFFTWKDILLRSRDAVLTKWGLGVNAGETFLRCSISVQQWEQMLDRLLCKWHRKFFT